jgi:hypothetical protein
MRMITSDHVAVALRGMRIALRVPTAGSIFPRYFGVQINHIAEAEVRPDGRPYQSSAG